MRSHGEIEIAPQGINAETRLALRPKQSSRSLRLQCVPRIRGACRQKLARKLNCAVGDTLIITTISPMTMVSRILLFSNLPSPASMRPEWRNMMIFMYLPLESARVFFQFPKMPCRVLISCSARLRARRLSPARLKNSSGTRFRAHGDGSNGGMFAWIELQKSPFPSSSGSSVLLLYSMCSRPCSSAWWENAFHRYSPRSWHAAAGDWTFILQGVTIGAAGTFPRLRDWAFALRIPKWFGVIHLEGDVYFVDVPPVAFSIWHFVVVVAFSLIISLCDARACVDSDEGVTGEGVAISVIREYRVFAMPSVCGSTIVPPRSRTLARFS